jgi:endonuclease/exonuclease/phosphatase (EEP) superfamily protein YafD
MYLGMGLCALAQYGQNEAVKSMNLIIIGEFIASVGIIVVGITTVAGFLGQWGWQLDLFSHFRVQYLFLLTGLTIFSLFFGGKVISYLGLAFIFLNLVTILPLYIPRRRTPENIKTSRILLCNVLRPNDHYEKLRQLIHTTSPDILVLIEISEVWLQELDSELKKYAHCHTAKRKDNYGIAIFSHYPIDDKQVRYFSDAKVPSLIAKMDIAGCSLGIIATHPPPPKSKQESLFRNKQLSNISEYAASQAEPYILLGDLNMTSWSPYFRKLIHQSGLHDSRQGFGIQPTWPADKSLFMVPIDHVLVSDGITIHDRFIGPQTGSDHRSVIVDFSLDACPT